MNVRDHEQKIRSAFSGALVESAQDLDTQSSEQIIEGLSDSFLILAS